MRLQDALSIMWQHEATSRAAIENGTEEGLGDSAESAPIAFPEDIQMEENHETMQNNPPGPVRRYEDQMVPSITSLVRAYEDETSSGIQNSVGDTRAEVPANVNLSEEPRRDTLNEGVFRELRPNNTRPMYNFSPGLHNDAEDSTAESSSASRRERDGGVVPVWSPSASSFSDQIVGDENGIGNSSAFLQRHPQSHQIINLRRLSQTG